MTRTIDPNTLLSNVSSPYGAPMGRRDITDNPDATVIVFTVTFEDGDYDMGGVYWGGGEQPLFCAMGNDFQVFRRAKNKKEAKEKLKKEFPGLTITKYVK